MNIVVNKTWHREQDMINMTVTIHDMLNINTIVDKTLTKETAEKTPQGNHDS